MVKEITCEKENFEIIEHTLRRPWILLLERWIAVQFKKIMDRFFTWKTQNPTKSSKLKSLPMKRERERDLQLHKNGYEEAPSDLETKNSFMNSVRVISQGNSLKFSFHHPYINQISSFHRKLLQIPRILFPFADSGRSEPKNTKSQSNTKIPQY